MNLILIEPEELRDDGRATIRGARTMHLQSVLGAGPGTVVRVGLVDGPLGRAKVESLEDGRAILACQLDEGVPQRPAIDILLALPRPKVLKRLWAQLAALGVGRIMLTNAARVERNYFDTHVLSESCYRPLLIEGLQQARDTRLPIVTVHRQLKILIEDDLDIVSGEAGRLVADTGPGVSVARAVGDSRHGRMLLAVGPEGGWTPFERDMFSAHGFRAITMGPRTLRSDTACIALLAQIHAAVTDGCHVPDRESSL